MVPQTQITEVKAELDYAVAHQCGPTYTGPTSGYEFHDGLVTELVPGWRLLQNSMATITHFWEAREGHELRWGGEAWVYEPAPVPDEEPEPKPRRGSRRRKGGTK